MHELDHHHENESRYSCDDCNDSGIHNETRDYCACRLGLARCNNDAVAEMLRGSPFTDAMWTMHQSTVKTAKAIAAADLALLKSKLLQKERELAEVRKDAERYRYLRGCDWFSSPLCVLSDPKKAVDTRLMLGADCPSRERLDAAIDAASVAQANKEQGNG
jgi:hypothetical protein